MAYATEKTKVGRRPFYVAKLKLDYCQENFGVSPCSVGRVASGTAQGGGSNYIDLSTGASSVDDVYNKMVVVIVGGTGIGQEGVVLDYDGSSRRCTMLDDWTTDPDNTSQYSVVNRAVACYNTRATCQDTTNYNPSTSTNVIWLTSEGQDFPVDILDESGVAVAIPCIDSVSMAPPRINLGQGIGMNASLSLKLKDFSHHDRGVDKYTDSRNYTPEDQGTFWGKFIARHKYYQGREIEILSGYLDSTTGQFDSANFQSRTYIIEKIDGPTNDVVTLVGKDIMKKMEGERALVPSPTSGSLDQAMTDSETGVISAKDIDITKYPSSGKVRISTEICSYSAISASSITISARAQDNTVAAAHSTDDNLQHCIEYSNTNVVTVIQDLLDAAKQSTVGYEYNAGIPTSYLDIADWADEEDFWLSSNNLTTILSEPISVKQLMSELLKENLLYMWWDEINKLVKLKAIAPRTSSGDLTDDDNFIGDTVKVQDDPGLRVTQYWVYYTRYDPTEDKTGNFRNLYIQIDTDSEGSDKYDESRARVIKSNWITGAGLALQTASRTLALMKDNPKIISFRLDAKDTVALGEYYNINTRHLQDADGSNLSLDVIILEAKEVDPGSTWEYLAQEFVFVGFYGTIGYGQAGTVQAATANTITLESEAHDDDDVYIDGYVSIPSISSTDYLVIDWDSATKLLTIEGTWGTTPTASVDTYRVHLPNYSNDRLEKETDGEYILLETGDYLLLESATGPGATEEQVDLYSWICQNSGEFADGTEGYKIL